MKKPQSCINQRPLRQKCNLNNIFHEGKGHFATGKIKGTFENLGALAPLITPPPPVPTPVTTMGVLYVLHVITTLIPLEKIKIADISIILKRSQKSVIGKIEVKVLGKNQNGTT